MRSQARESAVPNAHNGLNLGMDCEIPCKYPAMQGIGLRDRFGADCVAHHIVLRDFENRQQSGITTRRAPLCPAGVPFDLAGSKRPARLAARIAKRRSPTSAGLFGDGNGNPYPKSESCALSPPAQQQVNGGQHPAHEPRCLTQHRQRRS